MSLSKKNKIYSDFIDQSDKIVLEFSGSGIKFYCFKIQSDKYVYILNAKGQKEFYLSKNKTIEEVLFDNEEYNNILEELCGEKLYIFISNGHVEAIREGNTLFNSTSKMILKIIKEMDEDNEYFKDLNIAEVSEQNYYFTEEEIKPLETYQGDYSDLSKQHYYGPETEDRLEANAFATLFEEGKIQEVEKIDYPYCLLFAGSTTIQVMRIDKVNNKIKYESATKPYVVLHDIIYDDNDPFMNLLLNNKIVFFGSNFAWAFLYKENLSDMTMKKVELLGDGEIQIVDGDSFQFNADFTSYHTCENDKEKCGSEEERVGKNKINKPNCCYSTIKGESWRGFSNFCSIIFHGPTIYFKRTIQNNSSSNTLTTELLPNFYFFRTVKVDGVDVEITASRGLIDYSEGKINIPLPGTTTTPITTGAGPPHVERSIERPIKKKKTKKKASTKEKKKRGSTKQEKKRGSTKQEKKKGSTKKKNPKKKKTSTRKKI